MNKEERDQAEREKREELAALHEEELYATTHVQFPELDEKNRNMSLPKNRKADDSSQLVIPKHRRRKKTPNYMKAFARNKPKIEVA